VTLGARGVGSTSLSMRTSMFDRLRVTPKALASKYRLKVAVDTPGLITSRVSLNTSWAAALTPGAVNAPFVVRSSVPSKSKNGLELVEDRTSMPSMFTLGSSSPMSMARRKSGRIRCASGVVPPKLSSTTTLTRSRPLTGATPIVVSPATEKTKTIEWSPPPKMARASMFPSGPVSPMALPRTST
jgi:hypothetical protein